MIRRCTRCRTRRQVSGRTPHLLRSLRAAGDRDGRRRACQSRARAASGAARQNRVRPKHRRVAVRPAGMRPGWRLWRAVRKRGARFSRRSGEVASRERATRVSRKFDLNAEFAEEMESSAEENEQIPPRASQFAPRPLREKRCFGTRFKRAGKISRGRCHAKAQRCKEFLAAILALRLRSLCVIHFSHSLYATTMFTRRPGTTISFFTVLPAMVSATLGAACAAASMSD